MTRHNSRIITAVLSTFASLRSEGVFARAVLGDNETTALAAIPKGKSAIFYHRKDSDEFSRSGKLTLRFHVPDFDHAEPMATHILGRLKLGGLKARRDPANMFAIEVFGMIFEDCSELQMISDGGLEHEKGVMYSVNSDREGHLTKTVNSITTELALGAVCTPTTRDEIIDNALHDLLDQFGEADSWPHKDIDFQREILCRVFDAGAATSVVVA